jgi:hypothetical protein
LQPRGSQQYLSDALGACLWPHRRRRGRLVARQ